MNFFEDEYLRVGATNRGCLRIVPSQDKKPPGFVIGDDSGVVNYYEVRNGDVDPRFNSGAPTVRKEICRIELAGMPYYARDKVFFSIGTTIRAFRQGKMLHAFETNLTEMIRTIAVEENYLWVAGEHILNMYLIQKDTLRDMAYFVSPDRINDLLTLNIISPTIYSPVLACEDKAVRVLDAECRQHYQYLFPSAATCLVPFSAKAKLVENKGSLDRTILVGLQNGFVVCLSLEVNDAFKQWELPPPEDTIGGAVSCLKLVDLKGKGVNDIIVARDQGSLEVYQLNSNDYVMVYRTNVNEQITGLDAGTLSQPGYSEIILSTFSGRVLSFMNIEDVLKIETRKARDNPKDLPKRINTLSTEVERMRQQLETLKNRAESEQPRLNTTANIFRATSKFIRNAEDFSYTVQIDSQYPIESVILQSPMQLELIDLEVSANAQLAVTPTTFGFGAEGVLATYRLVEGARSKFEFKLRTVEGHYGILNIFVIPVANPKTSQSLQIPVRPLSLHERIVETSLDEGSLPLNILTIKGSFSFSDMNSWMNQALPEVPKTEDEQARVIYRSTFVGTVLIADYQAGSAIFKSDSISTITILKDVISFEANRRGLQVAIDWEMNDASIKRVLTLLREKIDHLNDLSVKNSMIPALKELATQEGSGNFLSQEYQKILDNSDRITAEFKQQPKKLQYLKGYVMDLFVDRCKLKGLSNVGQRTHRLTQALGNYQDMDTIYQIFMS
eukprot:TRINITY_DN7043_c0_g1_i3.p1 TRINITY_DN7043_c0_g1~~TRINITY_DN7043_c0_g1_i3.p1  ORF type:complete len:729 (-),score=128.21 TRINITY_DN7043_c0_g1_i3:32-2218(-)